MAITNDEQENSPKKIKHEKRSLLNDHNDQTK